MSGGYNCNLYATFRMEERWCSRLNPNPAVSGSGMNITLMRR